MEKAVVAVTRVIDAAIAQAVKEEREACATVAKSHIGSAAKKRKERGQKLSTFDPDTQREITSEERGEDIAAQCIELAIRARRQS